LFHVSDSPVHAHKNSPCDNAVADGKFPDFPEPFKGLDGVIADTVSGIDPEFEFGADLGGIHDA